MTSTAAHAYLLAQYEEQASLIVKMEEIKSLSEEKQAKLEEVKESKSHLEASRELREDLEGRIDKCRISPGQDLLTFNFILLEFLKDIIT